MIVSPAAIRYEIDAKWKGHNMSDEMQTLRADLVLFANDLGEYQRLPEGRAIISAFYDSAWGDFDLPESYGMAAEMGALPTSERDNLIKLLNNYWTARNA